MEAEIIVDYVSRSQFLFFTSFKLWPEGECYNPTSLNRQLIRVTYAKGQRVFSESGQGINLEYVKLKSENRSDVMYGQSHLMSSGFR